MIAVRWRCKCIRPRDSTVMVRPRREGEDLDSWMKELQQAVGADHKRQSPMCRSVKTDYVKIPLHESNPAVGGAPRVH